MKTFLNIFVIHLLYIFQDCLDEETAQKQHLFEIEIICNIINVFTVTFDQFNASSWIKVLMLFFFFLNVVVSSIQTIFFFAGNYYKTPSKINECS